ncbi:MAG TPA: bifunctional phosphoribosylaminoimidazolecarboxamide formyltransferase/IMP cyclohydrolase, partial [Mycobacteriales bacterium]|nr:bifunctional phosphoribosylaminoimidazolecarboxamide formyltransferase/IMP cyclohydrolase [Mycobacteriales bacterium]
IGAGQMNRRDSARIAAAKAIEAAQTHGWSQPRTVGSAVASDAYFPFADGPQVLIDAGVRAIVEPGGSVRDDETIEACKAAGVTLYLTDTRHFFH